MQGGTFSPAFVRLPFFSQTLYPSRANAHTFLCLDICGPEAWDSCHLCRARAASRPSPAFLAWASDRRGCAWPLLTEFSEGTSSRRCSATLFISHRERGRDGICGTLSGHRCLPRGPRSSPRGASPYLHLPPPVAPPAIWQKISCHRAGQSGPCPPSPHTTGLGEA